MPNYVTNIIKSNKTITDEILNTLDTGDVNFDFNTIIPTPEYIFQGPLGNAERAIVGSDNWYDWNIENWGTKWNAVDTARISEDSFSFDTAWANPEPVILALSLKYPKTLFQVAYADEDLGSNAGVYIVKNGIIEHEIDVERIEWLACEFASQLKYGESYTLNSEQEIADLLAQIESDELSYEKVEDELDSLRDSVSAYKENVGRFLEEYPGFDFSDPFDYLNISDKYMAKL